MNFSGRSEQLSGWMVDVRRDLHRNPELSFKEERTGGLVAGFLTEWGYRVRRIGGTGVHGFLEGGDCQRRLLLLVEPRQPLGFGGESVEFRGYFALLPE